jgi:DNA mismatch repair protein MSH5
MLELDNSIGDVHANIKDAEAIIASELEDDILDCGTELRETYSALADLDCILSLASSASDHNYVRPVVVSSEEKCILIQNGGHPLHEHIIDSNFIRNHAVIDETNRVNIVSGPNYSGKSCYARQVGVLVYMAHIGSFIPCERARISIVDRILTQFSVVETCTVPQSSFQLDLTRMARIMNSATENSLVLIDEFGKGNLTRRQTTTDVVIVSLHSLDHFTLRHWLTRVSFFLVTLSKRN